MGVRHLNMRSAPLIAVWVLAATCAPLAQASIGTLAVSFDATSSAGGHGHYQAYFIVPSEPHNGHYTYSLPQPVQLRDPISHQLISTVNRATIDYYGDPQINLIFSMQNGGSPAVFTAQSALLSFDPLTNPQARASAGINLTDTDGNGASLSAAPGHTGAFLAQYNGFVPGGTTFAEGISQIVVQDPFGSASDNLNVPPGGGYSTIPGVVHDMSSQISFTISAFDIASGTSNFEIVPEPAGLLAVLLGLVCLRRR